MRKCSEKNGTNSTPRLRMEQHFVSLVLSVGSQQQKGKDEEKGTGQRPWDQRGRTFMDRMKYCPRFDGEERELVA